MVFHLSSFWLFPGPENKDIPGVNVGKGRGGRGRGWTNRTRESESQERKVEPGVVPSETDPVMAAYMPPTPGKDMPESPFMGIAPDKEHNEVEEKGQESQGEKQKKKIVKSSKKGDSGE